MTSNEKKINRTLKDIDLSEKKFLEEMDKTEKYIESYYNKNKILNDEKRKLLYNKIYNKLQNFFNVESIENEKRVKLINRFEKLKQKYSELVIKSLEKEIQNQKNIIIELKQNNKKQILFFIIISVIITIFICLIVFMNSTTSNAIKELILWIFLGDKKEKMFWKTTVIFVSIITSVLVIFLVFYGLFLLIEKIFKSIFKKNNISKYNKRPFKKRQQIKKKVFYQKLNKTQEF
ncbi:hypothetical protein [Mesomycoplasma lagogenitalium]|uniref:Uncharacterized protein n=1 Tax=Mesomycoplasma lagogenitalium TaxID=171286 RepID=A0ABY8LVG6_9BACT|nr:hypothetical protein [Mesomycoplasma lagogenitalium]WGI36523.1 hypothetical protein QEG99_03595 [Mesomycoplasma lagogenitalium]